MATAGIFTFFDPTRVEFSARTRCSLQPQRDVLDGEAGRTGGGQRGLLGSGGPGMMFLIINPPSADSEPHPEPGAPGSFEHGIECGPFASAAARVSTMSTGRAEARVFACVVYPQGKWHAWLQ